MTFIVVKDSYEALLAMAAFARARTQATIIAVTGSVGKTGTKEAIRIACETAGSVYATKGNLNNHIGLPLSLAQLPQDAHIGVFELGMNHAGEIAFLTRMARPDIAVITNVEAVHLEFFANVEAIADAKAEIMQGLPATGTIVLNRDNAHYERLLAHAQRSGITRVITFGEHETAQCRLLNYALTREGSVVEAVIMGTPVQYRLGTMGRQYAFTSLAALAASSAAGMDLAQSAAALAHFREPEGRGRVVRVSFASGALTMIDDCYNASPVSMKAGIQKLSELHAQHGGGRKIAVLGDMLELGEDGANLHKLLLSTLLEEQIDKVFTAGKLMQGLYDTLPTGMRGAQAADSQKLLQPLFDSLQPDDMILIKGSYGSRMSVIRDALTAQAQTLTREPTDAL